MFKCILKPFDGFYTKTFLHQPKIYVKKQVNPYRNWNESRLHRGRNFASGITCGLLARTCAEARGRNLAPVHTGLSKPHLPRNTSIPQWILLNSPLVNSPMLIQNAYIFLLFLLLYIVVSHGNVNIIYLVKYHPCI